MLAKASLNNPEGTLRNTEFWLQLSKHLDEEAPRYLIIFKILLTFPKLVHSHYIILVPQAVKLASQLPNFSLLGIHHFLKCSLQPKPSWNPRKELIKHAFTSSCSQMFSWQNLRPKPLSDVYDTWLSIKTWTKKVNLFLEQKRLGFFFNVT